MINNAYMMISVDGLAFSGKNKPAHSIVRSRLINRTWPIYQKTQYKNKFSTGDQLYFYVGGRRSHKFSILGKAIIDDVSGQVNFEYSHEIDLSLIHI